MSLMEFDQEKLNMKADKQELWDLVAMKTNKTDTQNLMRCLDIQHKMLTQQSVLFVECMRCLVTMKKESQVAS